MRRGTAADWTSANPTLASGEGGFETDTKKLKLGDGSTAWNSLAYIGGTGTGMATDTLWGAKGDLAVATANDTATRQPVGSNDQVLVADSGQATGVKWAAVPGISGYVALSVIDAKGDLYVGSANDTVDNLTVGTDGQVLTANAAATLGVEWADATGGSGSSFGVEVPAGTVNGSNDTFTLSEAPDPSADLLLFKNGMLMKQGLDYTLTADTITFDAAQIPQTGDILLAAIPTSGGGGSGTTIGRSQLVYRYTVAGSDKASIDTGTDTPDAGDNVWSGGDLLEIELYLRTDEAVTGSVFDIFINNDTGTNYDWTLTQVIGTTGTNATVSGNQARAQTSIQDLAAGANASANAFSVHKIEIPNYCGTTGWKVGKLYSDKIDPSAINTMLGRTWGIQYRSTSAITRFAIQPNTSGKKLKVGSQMTIWKRLSA